MYFRPFLLFLLATSQLGIGRAFTSDSEGGLEVALQVPEVIYEEQLIAFNCTTAEDVVVLSTSWSLNGSLLSGESAQQLVLTVNSTLDGVCLSCHVVSSPDNISLNASQPLRVVSRSPSLVEYPMNQTVAEGEPLLLMCRGLGLPPPVVTLMALESFLLPDIAPGVSFINKTAEVEDAGAYSCSVGEILAPTAFVTIIFSPEPVTAPESMSVLVRARVELNCSFSGFPYPNITWWHNREAGSGRQVLPVAGRVEVSSMPFQENGRVGTRGFLRISSALLSDMGYYECLATNHLGTNNSDASNLLVGMFPTFTQEPRADEMYDVGESVQLFCAADGVPEVVYTWERNTRTSVADVFNGNATFFPLEASERVVIEGGVVNITSTLRGDGGEYRCTVSNEHASIRSSPASFYIAAVPAPPEGLQEMAQGAGWIRVQWQASTSDLPITNYLLEYKLHFESMWSMHPDQASFLLFRNVTPVYPNAMYEFRVRARNGRGLSPYSAAVSVSTLAGAPVAGLLNAPLNVSVETLGPRSLSVSWLIPEVLERTAYMTTMLTLHNLAIVLQLMSPPAVFRNLSPATNYSITLSFIFVGEASGTPLTMLVTTEDGVPSAPIIAMAESLGPRSLRVSWEPPSIPNGAIVTYTLYYSAVAASNNVSVGGELTWHVLDSLSPYTNYSITVSAHTSAGEGPTSNLTRVRTDQDVPPAPSGVGVAPVNSTAVAVTWQEFMEDEVPGVLLNFTVCYNQCRYGNEEEECVLVSTERTAVIIGGLQPYSEYCVTVQAATGAGLGDPSHPQAVRTLGDVPTEDVGELVVMEICPSGGLSVQWDPPNPHLLGGPMEEVQYELSFNPVSSPAEQETLFLNYTPSLSTYTLLDLQPYTNYTISLAISNQNGSGPSTTISASTCDAAADPPEGVNVMVISSTSLEVSWKAMSEVPGVLEGYVIRYGPPGGNFLHLNVSISDGRRRSVNDLEPFTQYLVGVATQTRGPLGEFSEGVLVQTMGAAPDLPVHNVSVVAPCPTQVSVQWLPQQLRAPANETRYVVSYQRTDRQDPVQVIIPYSEGAGATLSGVEPDTEYGVTVTVRNLHGTGPSTEASLITTPQQGVSIVPGNVLVEASNSSVLVRWSGAANVSYSVHYHLTSTADTQLLGAWLQTSPQSELSASIPGLRPFTNYSLVVMASTMCRRESSEVMVVRTLPSLPTVPLDFTVSAVLPTQITFSWRRPAYPNGILTHYLVHCGAGEPQRVDASSMSYRCDDLQPQSLYNISVAAGNDLGEGPASLQQARTTCHLLYDTEDDMLMLGSCTIKITYVLVVVQELVSYADGRYDPPTQTIDTYSLQQLLLATNEGAGGRGQDSGGAGGRGRRQEALNAGNDIYIAANLTEEELNSFVLGDGNDYGGFSNYPLKDEVFYNLALLATTPGTDTPIFFSSPEPVVVEGESSEPTGLTEAAIPLVPVVAGAGAAGILILAICMAALVSCVCCCCNRSLDKTDGVTGLRIERTGSFRLSKKKLSDPIEDFRASNKTEALEDHPPVPVVGFINKLMVMRTNDNQLFLEEFGSIPMTMAQLATDTASMHVNKPKNRYNNILPYDLTRVKLKAGHNSDYINANYCSGYRKTKAYIATQGPLPDTVPDFWRMVWDENARTVVMLTNTQEKGKIKCGMYWPREVGCSSVYGNLEVSLATVTTLADYSIRKLTLHKSGSSKEPREVVQFHFTSWPDHGVPQYATAMLAMLRRVRAHYSNEEGPMLVHCSAGVGRTGTFIVIDTMLQRLMHEEDLLDIYGHVSLLRSQRNYMIQTEDQYFFVHEAIAEALLCGNTEVTLDKLQDYVEDLYSVIPGDESETTNLELQFKRLALDRNDPHRWTTANKDANKTKNRFVNVLPYDSSRVCLEYSPGVDGSDYINASHVDSYHSRRAFIATQGPLPSTVDDFWRMMWQYSVPVVIMLTQDVEKGRECSAPYWPDNILQPISWGKLRVELNVERNSGSYSYRDLSVTKDGEKRLVRQFQFHGWPEVGVPSPVVLIEFIREVQKLCQSLSTPHGPIVVHCGNGVGRTGVFLALHIIMERMLVEGLVDVFQTVKNLRIQRPAMVQTLEQYHFCYDTALNFLQSPEFLPPQPLLSRQHGSSQRGSRRGSHSSMDSRKKSKNSSPARSPTRSVSQQRNTPVRSESLKESPRGTMEMKPTGSGSVAAGGVETSQVYGASDTTSTFGSHPAQAAQPTADSVTPVAVEPPTVAAGQAGNSVQSPNNANNVGNHIQHGNQVPYTNASSTPVLAASQTPVTPHMPMPASSLTSPSHGVGSDTPLASHGVTSYGAGSDTPLASHATSSSQTPIVASLTPASTPAATPIVPHTPPVPAYGSQSPFPELSQPSVFSGSQTPGFGSQTLSMFSGSQTPPISHLSLSSSNSQPQTSHGLNNQHYHQLVEAQRYTPNSALGTDSTPL